MRLCHKRAATCIWNEEARERVFMICSGRSQVHCLRAKGRTITQSRGLLVAQGFDGIKAGRFDRGIYAKE